MAFRGAVRLPVQAPELLMTILYDLRQMLEPGNGPGHALPGPPQNHGPLFEEFLPKDIINRFSLHLTADAFPMLIHIRYSIT
jgi:hypothetical protein